MTLRRLSFDPVKLFWKLSIYKLWSFKIPVSGSSLGRTPDEATAVLGLVAIGAPEIIYV